MFKKSLSLALAMVTGFMPGFNKSESVRKYQGASKSRPKNKRGSWYSPYTLPYSKGRNVTMTAAQQKRAAKKRSNKRKHPRG